MSGGADEVLATTPDVQGSSVAGGHLLHDTTSSDDNDTSVDEQSRDEEEVDECGSEYDEEEVVGDDDEEVEEVDDDDDSHEEEEVEDDEDDHEEQEVEDNEDDREEQEVEDNEDDNAFYEEEVMEEPPSEELVAVDVLEEVMVDENGNEFTEEVVLDEPVVLLATVNEGHPDEEAAANESRELTMEETAVGSLNDENAIELPAVASTDATDNPAPVAPEGGDESKENSTPAAAAAAAAADDEGTEPAAAVADSSVAPIDSFTDASVSALEHKAIENEGDKPSTHASEPGDIKALADKMDEAAAAPGDNKADTLFDSITGPIVAAAVQLFKSDDNVDDEEEMPKQTEGQNTSESLPDPSSATAVPSTDPFINDEPDDEGRELYLDAQQSPTKSLTEDASTEISAANNASEPTPQEESDDRQLGSVEDESPLQNSSVFAAATAIDKSIQDAEHAEVGTVMPEATPETVAAIEAAGKAGSESMDVSQNIFDSPAPTEPDVALTSDEANESIIGLATDAGEAGTNTQADKEAELEAEAVANGSDSEFSPKRGSFTIEKVARESDVDNESEGNSHALFLVPAAAAAAAAIADQDADDDVPLDTDSVDNEEEDDESDVQDEPIHGENHEVGPTTDDSDAEYEDGDDVDGYEDEVYEEDMTEKDDEGLEEETLDDGDDDDLIGENAPIGDPVPDGSLHDESDDLERGREESFDDSHNKGDERRKPDKASIILICLIVLVLVILVIALPFVLRRGASDDQPQGSITNAPTGFPTSAPTITRIPFTLASGPFSADAGSGFGYTASLANDITVVGAPRQDDVGSVTSYLDVGGWIQNDIISGSQAGQLFGYSVDVQDEYMVAGAPGTFAEGSDFAAVGAVFSYELDRGLSTWSQRGSTIRGEADIDSFDEMFGASVATSGLIVAVGAPKRKSGSGGVYTFRYQSIDSTGESDWVNMTSIPLAIKEKPSGSQFGTSVAISSDGSRIMAGAPEWGGGRGYVVVYEWDETASEWSTIFENAGNATGGKYGSSLAFLDTETIAIGEPGGAKSGRGVVRVYQARPDGGTFEQVGTGIEGSRAGDALGNTGTISGRTSSDRTVSVNAAALRGAASNMETVGTMARDGGNFAVLTATSKGAVEWHEYDGSQWVRPFMTVSKLGGPVTSLSMSGQTDAFIVGVASASTASFYTATDASQGAPTMAPSTYSTDAPLNIPTVTPSVESTDSSPSILTESPTLSVATDVPTIAPSANLNLGEWELVAYFSGEQQLGSSVAIASTTMASGDRVSGTLNTYQLAGGSWSLADNLTTIGTKGGFGASVALDEEALLMAVGAPGAFAVGSTAVTTGAVFVYTLSASGGWTQGAELRGAESIYSTGESFGGSVAVSSGGSVIIVGAQFNGEDNVANRGRVYAFQGGLGASYAAVEDTPLLGTSSGDFFGSAVAVSNDGTTMFVGAPGGESGSGYVSVYRFDGSSWGSPVSTLLGSTSNELLGTSLAVLSPDGSVFAAGASNYNGGTGAIRVFQRQEDGTYAPLGDPIVGNSDGSIGGINSISGSEDNGVPSLLFASSSGIVSTYQFLSGVWIAAMEPILTGLKGSPDLRGSTGLESFVAGNRNEVVIYSMSQ